MMKVEAVSVKRLDGIVFTIGDRVCINQSFPRVIVAFKTINGHVYAGFDYGREGILYNELHELFKQ